VQDDQIYTYDDLPAYVAGIVQEIAMIQKRSMVFTLGHDLDILPEAGPHMS